MKAHVTSLLAIAVPTMLAAQVSGQASASASATAEVKAPASFSAEGQAKLNAMYAEAKEHHVPREPMQKRVDEGKAKGASEATIIASAGKVKGNLEASQSAMIEAGRQHPSDEECTRAANAMERGVTKAQITAIAKDTKGDRSLVVAFDVLSKLTLRGVPVAQAVAQVETNVSSGASDAQLTALVSAAGNSSGAKGAVNSTENVATKPAGATVTTAVGGIVKKP